MWLVSSMSQPIYISVIVKQVGSLHKQPSLVVAACLMRTRNVFNYMHSHKEKQ